MVLSRIGLAIVAVMAAGMLWIEHGHRIFIATPAAAETAQPAASLCPDTDDVPLAPIASGSSMAVSCRRSTHARMWW